MFLKKKTEQKKDEMFANKKRNEYKEFCSNPTVQKLLQSMVAEFTYPLPLLRHVSCESPNNNTNQYLLEKRSGDCKFWAYPDRIECLETFDPEHYEGRMDLWKYTFTDHGFSNQTDPQKLEFIINAFAELIVPEYLKRIPNASISSIGSSVDFTLTRQIPNPNYNTAKW